jgi:formiminoglutamase
MKFNKNYDLPDTKIWGGRIDSLDNYDAFRWHQWIKLLDLNNPDDFEVPLSEGEKGICFIGFCSDEGVLRNLGRTGASKAPESIRHEMANLPCSFSKKIRLFDCGDITIEDNNLEEGQAILGMAVEQIISAGLFPIVIGGGHETALGNYLGIQAGIEKKFPNGNLQSSSLGIVNFDAHFDLRPYGNGGSSGSMFRQIADLRKSSGLDFSYYCLGIQKHSNTVQLFKTAADLNAKYALAKDIIHGDDWNILESLDEFIDKNNQIYVTVCADVFSTAYAPGVSAAQSLGLDPEKVIIYIKHIIKSGKMISFDICEVSPRFDLDSATSDLASVIIYSIITTLDD